MYLVGNRRCLQCYFVDNVPRGGVRGQPTTNWRQEAASHDFPACVAECGPCVGGCSMQAGSGKYPKFRAGYGRIECETVKAGFGRIEC